ncbi:MAG: hypothetical protein A3G41_02745 [Elusimicrobia bacterium RIFCSPLOWO2_12_FULL_59_9]|nr:MAG: hypothetical protein A3G41_02745 [Elusimicrobia bacterium RIFCSPLOWO2_12_FULL_59_9]
MLKEIAAVAVTTLVTGVGLYWYFRFQWVLPLKRSVAAKEKELAEAAQIRWQMKKTEKQLQEEIETTIQELTSTNAKLIERAREMKTLYEVASSVSTQIGQSESSLSAIVSILTKALRAEICVFYMLDAEKKVLEAQPGAMGLAYDEVDRQQIDLSDKQNSTVRVFLEGSPESMGEFAPADPERNNLCRVQSLVLEPLRQETKTIGVLRVGSLKKNFFTQDQIHLVHLVAEEASVIVEGAMLYKRLAHTAEELKRLNRVKDDFLSTVSHELKTPLTTIKGFIAILLMEEAGNLNDQQKQFLKMVTGSVGRLEALISDLLDIAKLEGGVAMETEPVSLIELAKACVESLSVRAGQKNIKLEGEFPSSMPVVLADQQWISQVIDNLISNAIKFTPEGGRVTVSVQDKGGLALVCVQDTGVGIKEEERQNLFHKFYRAPSHAAMNVPGTGLGLAITKSVVEKHGGNIWVESTKGEGSKFYFVLPVAKTYAPAEAA